MLTETTPDLTPQLRELSRDLIACIASHPGHLLHHAAISGLAAIDRYVLQDSPACRPGDLATTADFLTRITAMLATLPVNHEHTLTLRGLRNAIEIVPDQADNCERMRRQTPEAFA